MTLRLPFILCLVLGVAMPAAGQRNVGVSRVNITGELVQAGPRSIIVKAGDGKNWTVALGGGTKITIKGTSVPEMITARVCLRFIASIDKKTCKAQDKLDKVTIFSQTPGVANRTLGVELAKDAAQGDAKDDAGPGGMPPRGQGGPPNGRVPGQGPPPDQGPAADPGIPGTVDEPSAAKPKRGSRSAKGPAVPEVASYEVCGQVQSFHSHRLILNAPNSFFKSRITAELSPDAEIALDISDLSVAKPGDKVSVKGLSMIPGVCQRTESLTVTLSSPLGEKPGHSHRPRPAAKGNDASHHPLAKAKPDAAAPADQNPAPTDEKPAPEAPADKPVLNKDRPKDDEAPVMDDPNAKPAPAPAPLPKPDDTKPDEKKTDGTEKKPPQKNEEKDIFEK